MRRPRTIYELPPRCWLKPPRLFHPAQDLLGARSRDTHYLLWQHGLALQNRLDRWALRKYAARYRYREQFARGQYDNDDGISYGRTDYWNNLTRGQASTRSRSITRLPA